MYKAKEEKMLKKSNKEIKKKKSQDQGITLIALVITIIILLILAGVTLNAAIGENGLFQRAKLATEKYEEAEANETASLEQLEKEIKNAYIDYNDYVGIEVTGYKPKVITDGCSIGTETSGADTLQKFKTDEGMKWRIWDYDNATGIVRIISEKPTQETLQLSKVNGYNNGVWAINDICSECYTMEGIKGIYVTSLKRSDIQKVSTYDYTEYKHKQNDWKEFTDSDTNGEETLIQYGETKTYKSPQYPAMWYNFDRNWTYKYDKEKQEKTGGDKEGKIWEENNGCDGSMTGSDSGGSDLTFTQSYYAHEYKENKNEFVNAKYYDILFKDMSGSCFGKTYWLAGRYARLHEIVCDFGLHNVYAYNNYWGVFGGDVFSSNRWRARSYCCASPRSFNRFKI